MLLNANRREQDLIYQNGNLPFIPTQAGVFDYAIANAWTVDEVLIDRDATYDYTTLRLEDYVYSGVDYYRVLNVRSDPWKQGDQTARVTFTNLDPGDTTELFRRISYRLPTQILTPRIQHDMPAGTDHYLMDATIALINAIDDHSKYQEARQWVVNVLKPQFLGEIDKGAQGTPLSITPRAF
jgi:hypothetical protein